MIGRTLNSVRCYGTARATTLSNGVRVATQQTKDRVATVGAYVDAGSRDETAETLGLSQVLSQIAQQPNEALEGRGSRINAHVDREQTSYTAKVLPDSISTAVGELGKIVAGDFSNIEQAKQRVLTTNDADRPISELLLDRLHMSTFRDGPLGNSLLGPHQNTSNLDASTAAQFVQQNYSADRIVVAAAGDVDHDSLVRLAEENFRQETLPKASILEKPYFCGTQLIYRNDDMGPILYFALGYEGVPSKNPDALAFYLIKHIIGEYKRDDYHTILPGTLSGNRTINRIANKMNVGCAEEFQAFNYSYRDTGLFGVFAACDEIAAENCAGELQFSINILSGGITDEEIMRAKRDLRVAHSSGITGTSELVNRLGTEVLKYGRTISAEELTTRLSYIDAEEIRRVAWKYIHDSEISSVALGPAHGFPTVVHLRRDNMMQRY